MNFYSQYLSHTVSERDHGKRLKSILREHLQISRRFLKTLKITEGAICLNGQNVPYHVCVKVGDYIQVFIPKETSDEIIPQNIPIKIIYEDEDLLIINKDAGIIVHPTFSHKDQTLANAVMHYWQEKGEEYRFRPAHRLDKDTSGIIVIAKSQYIHQQIAAQFATEQIQKTYVGISYGCPSPVKDMIDQPIGRLESQPQRRFILPEGKAAQTYYETISSNQEISFLQIKPITGRTHQIRVHLHFIGHPLLGDYVYGNEKADALSEQYDMNRQALHAHKLSFFHPNQKKTMNFEAIIPDDFCNALKKGNLL